MAGFPNGRRVGDDVVDIALQAMAGATPLTPAFQRVRPTTGSAMVWRRTMAVSGRVPVPHRAECRTGIDAVAAVPSRPRCIGSRPQDGLVVSHSRMEAYMYALRLMSFRFS